jgi:EAL domain-containing protein (putative c-di-GMP-specific phosphodiesterase class I)/GGDEF domain-containing protein
MLATGPRGSRCPRLDLRAGNGQLAVDLQGAGHAQKYWPLQTNSSVIFSLHNRRAFHPTPAVTKATAFVQGEMTANGTSLLELQVAAASERPYSSRALTYAQFLDQTGRELERTRRCLGSRFDLLCIETDCYLATMALLGREAAERLSPAAAEHIATLLWPRDAIVLLGHGRIGVLLETQSVARTTADFIDDVQTLLMGGFFHDDREIRTTASVGIARLTGSYHTAASVLDDAAAALARARREGRARSARFSQFVDRRLDLTGFGPDVTSALERNELEIVYQPIVSAETGKLDAFEALLRWRHPSAGLQQPEEFISSLEKAGLMGTTGEWMIETVAAQAGRWTAQSGRTIPLTLNVSGAQLRSASLVDALTRAVAGSDDISILIEVREEEILADRDTLVPVLSKLRDSGVRVVLEGIGTAACCLEYIASLPIDAIKLDAGFAESVTRYASQNAAVTRMVELAHDLDLDVIGMRVERPEQMSDAMAVCDEIQGFLVSHPVDAETATAMVECDWMVALGQYEMSGSLS